jgi:CubicO group peptidase (beta-lactamase class C family)
MHEESDVGPGDDGGGFDPGSKCHYSDSDNVAVTPRVESATNKTYEGQFRKQMYDPLGLKKTTLPRGPNMKEPFVHGYDNVPLATPRRPQRGVRCRMGVGIRRHSIDARRPERLHTRLRRR